LARLFSGALCPSGGGASRCNQQRVLGRRDDGKHIDIEPGLFDCGKHIDSESELFDRGKHSIKRWCRDHSIGRGYIFAFARSVVDIDPRRV
jgi:hypothetical protein